MPRITEFLPTGEPGGEEQEDADSRRRGAVQTPSS